MNNIKTFISQIDKSILKSCKSKKKEVDNFVITSNSSTSRTQLPIINTLKSNNLNTNSTLHNAVKKGTSTVHTPLKPLNSKIITSKKLLSYTKQSSLKKNNFNKNNISKNTSNNKIIKSKMTSKKWKSKTKKERAILAVRHLIYTHSKILLKLKNKRKKQIYNSKKSITSKINQIESISKDRETFSISGSPGHSISSSPQKVSNKNKYDRSTEKKSSVPPPIYNEDEMRIDSGACIDIISTTSINRDKSILPFETIISSLPLNSEDLREKLLKEELIKQSISRMWNQSNALKPLAHEETGTESLASR